MSKYETKKNVDPNAEYIPDLQKVAKTLAKNKLELKSDRQILSSGFSGPIYELTAANENGTEITIVEKTFATGGFQENPKKGRRFMIVKAEAVPPSQDVRTRLGLIERETGEVKEVVIDWLYNEERALKDLAGLPGIPKSYGPVYDGLKGSILEQKIDGYDLALVWIGEIKKSEAEINQICDRLTDVYVAAAKKGYIYNNPAGSTVMIENASGQPYLIDWYMHSVGDINVPGRAREKYLEGLKDIERYRADALADIKANLPAAQQKK